MEDLPIDNEIFKRCQVLFAFADYNELQSNASLDPSLVINYSPGVCGQFNLEWRVPENPTNVHAYDECMPIRYKIPYYRQPKPDSQFPSQMSEGYISQPQFSSLLPLLIAAQRNKINIAQYQVISERNSLRKIAMNNECYVIGVQKLGPTLFLRRHDCRAVNMNDYGHRFERMCTPQYNVKANYYQLIEGHLGDLRTLIIAETDAIHKQTQQAIELKCRTDMDISHKDLSQYWLQAFLGGVSMIKNGHRINDRIVRIQDVTVANMISNQEKDIFLNRLHQILNFLSNYVCENEVFLFARRTDQSIGKRQLYLYKVARQDKPQLTFITKAMLDQVVSNKRNPMHQGVIRDTELDRPDGNPYYDSDENFMDSDEDEYDDENLNLGSRFDKKNRLEKRKKENIVCRHTADQ